MSKIILLGMVSNVFVCAVLHYLTVVAHCFTTFTKKSLNAKRIFGGARSSNMLVQETITIAPFPKMACMPLALQLQFLQIQNSVQYFRVLHC